MKDGFFISDGVFGSMGHFLKCHKCGRKIIVEFVINGTNHNMNVAATCAECVVLSEDFKKNNPEEAKKIEEFVKE